MKEILPRGCPPPHGIPSNSDESFQGSKQTPQLPSISSSHSSLVGLLRDNNEGEDMDPHQSCGAVTPVPRPCTCRSAIVLKSDQDGNMDHKLADWLTRCVHFAKSIPDVAKLPHKDRVLLLTSAWKELVLLYMAQNDFDFDFVLQSQICHSYESSQTGNTNKHHDCVSRLWIEGVPTVKSVEQLRFILRKFCEMQPDDKEYALLRMLLLLNADLRGLSNTAAVESANERAHTALMEYESLRYTSIPLRLSHLLLLLPGVRGFSTRVFENLFYRHLVGDTTVESVLVQLLSD